MLVRGRWERRQGESAVGRYGLVSTLMCVYMIQAFAFTPVRSVRRHRHAQSLSPPTHTYNRASIALCDVMVIIVSPPPPFRIPHSPLCAVRCPLPPLPTALPHADTVPFSACTRTQSPTAAPLSTPASTVYDA